jgi:hypothetical protein
MVLEVSDLLNARHEGIQGSTGIAPLIHSHGTSYLYHRSFYLMVLLHQLIQRVPKEHLQDQELRKIKQSQYTPEQVTSAPRG